MFGPFVITGSSGLTFTLIMVTESNQIVIVVCWS